MNDATSTHGRHYLRDPANGYLGGVCAGLARGLRVPPIVVRIATVVVAIIVWTPLALIAYGAAWLFVDSVDERRSRLARRFLS